MNQKIASILAALVLGVTSCAASDHAPAEGTLKVVTLDENATQLRHDFDAARGSVRLLFVIDPACSVCLRGLDDVNTSLLAENRDPGLQTFVVHTSVVGGTLENVAPASGLLDNPHVRHYWDPSGHFGREVTRALELRRGDTPVYAWDVWMVFDDKAELSPAGLPTPTLFMHQLPKLGGQPGRPYLDSDVLADQVRSLLASRPQSQASR